MKLNEFVLFYLFLPLLKYKGVSLNPDYSIFVRFQDYKIIKT